MLLPLLLLLLSSAAEETYVPHNRRFRMRHSGKIRRHPEVIDGLDGA